MENPKTLTAERIKEASNVLVTVSANPTVDQLAAAIGLTLVLSKLKKHATTVFSGDIPSTLEFLKPEETIEDNTDSLRDFIISLDKSKADKIRYKVEDTMVKIFITPYRTSIGENDLVFSQGDFNVDVVLAIGVHSREDLDQAITAHGRILHDATIVTVNTTEGSELGSINWVDPQASSLCEMGVALADLLKANAFDAQIATALLTGIVAETERFSNEKTTSETMNASAKLMAAGANQQLVASELEQASEPANPQATSSEAQDADAFESADETSVDDDGSLHISHDHEKEKEKDASPTAENALPPVSPPLVHEDERAKEGMRQVDTILPEPVTIDDTEPESSPDQASTFGLPPVGAESPSADSEGDVRRFLDAPPRSQVEEDAANQPLSTDTAPPSSDARFISEPPSMGGALSATADKVDQDMAAIGSTPSSVPLLNRDSGPAIKKHKTTSEPAKAPDTPPEAPVSDTPVDKPTDDPQNEVGAGEARDTTEKKTDKDNVDVLPRPIIDVLDDKTLKDIEKAVDSPHRSMLARDMGDKTLHDIEDSVGSPQKKAAREVAQLADAASKVSEDTAAEPEAMTYEAHETEPPEKQEAPEPAKAPDTSPEALASDAPVDKPASESADKPEKEAGTEAEAAKESEDNDLPDEAAIRSKIDAAIGAVGDSAPLAPLQGIATDGRLDVPHEATPPVSPPAPDDAPQTPTKDIHINQDGEVSFPGSLATDTTLPDDSTAASVEDPTAPPPVPPPMMPPTSPSV